MPPHIPQIYATADIHGSFKALSQCLRLSNFHYYKDTLIVLGDLVDGYPESMQVIDELQKIQNLILILGNHDKWFLDFLQFHQAPHIWLSQGGKATIASYSSLSPSKLTRKFKSHLQFLQQARYFYVDDNERLFLHGGLTKDTIKSTSLSEMLWNRTSYYKHLQSNYINPNFLEIFIGHTSTTPTNTTPVRNGNLWNIDQGAGFEGRLTLINVITKQYFQSDLSSYLYPYFHFFPSERE